jgi:hypothetical protein
MAKSAQKVLEIEIIEDDVEEETLEEELEEASDEDSDEVSEEELEVPEGGIADLVMDDDEIEEIYGEKASDFGDVGIAQFPALAERMAKYGRNEDKFLAHVAAGELVIPFQFLKDEAIKKRIFDVLEEAGVENPEAYVVGSDENDLNPTTGLPEFFLKKLFKGIAKVFKKIVKVIKKVLPVVLPIVLSFTPLGPIYGAAMGSGIGTLLAGGDLKDALKAGLISGATGALFKGFTGDKSFFGNVKEGLSGAGERFGATFDAVTDGVGGKPFFDPKFVPPSALEQGADLSGGAEKLIETTVEGSGKNVSDAVLAQDKASLVTDGTQFFDDVAFQDANAAALTQDAAILENVGSGVGEAVNVVAPTLTPDLSAVLEGLSPAQQAAFETLSPAAQTTYLQQLKVNTVLPGEALVNGQSARGTQVSVDPALADDRSIFKKGVDRVFGRGDRSKEMIAYDQQQAAQSAKKTLELAGKPTNDYAAKLAIDSAVKAATPGIITKYVPALAVGSLAASAGGFFDVPEQEEVGLVERDSQGNVITGQDLIEADPGRYMVKNLGSRVLNEETGEYEDADESGYYDTIGSSERRFTVDDREPSVFDRPRVMAAADGGIVYPRRSGGIMPNEGVAGKDSVRAMLMPGEFVMTTDAVRGLGQGNLDSGIQSMYSVMRNLERRGRATA